MRAPHGNYIYSGTTGSDSLDYSSLADGGYGVDFITAGGNDKVLGTIYDDNFILGKDAEFIDGNAGWDTVWYVHSDSGVEVNLNNILQHGGYAEGDQLYRIENVIGSQYGDALIGNAGANTLDGQGGNDKIYGGDGDDRLSGGDGNDFLAGEAGRDIISGGNGDDVMRGGAGADQFDGGDGVDTADYLSAPQVAPVLGFTGVVVNLASGQGALGDADGDTYTGVENVRGSAYNDGLLGDDHDNALYGNGGNDAIAGGAGADYLDGGGGVDTLSYYNSALGVTVNLGTNQASGGDAAGDTILNFENVIGSDNADVLVGSNGDNTITGGAGNDVLVGQGGVDRIEGGAGNDVMFGGSESDTFVFFAAHTNPGEHQGNDVITDYAVGTDHLEFWGGVVDSVSDLHFTQSGSNTIITYNDGTDPASITLVGVNTLNLLAHAQTDFLFT
jgi:Ca2+-binding RTX toxin-like protein